MQEAPCRQQPVIRAVGARVISPALQRGVGCMSSRTGNPEGGFHVKFVVLSRTKSPIQEK
jgi:hypothetical protein